MNTIVSIELPHVEFEDIVFQFECEKLISALSDIRDRFLGDIAAQKPIEMYPYLCNHISVALGFSKFDGKIQNVLNAALIKNVDEHHKRFITHCGLDAWLLVHHNKQVVDYLVGDSLGCSPWEVTTSANQFIFQMYKDMGLIEPSCTYVFDRLVSAATKVRILWIDKMIETLGKKSCRFEISGW